MNCNDLFHLIVYKYEPDKLMPRPNSFSIYSENNKEKRNSPEEP